MKMKRYSNIDELDSLCERGWEVRFWNEGCLLDGDRVYISPDDRHWSYVVQEQYVNEWSSCYGVMRCREIPRKYLDWCDNFDIVNYYSELLREAGKSGLRYVAVHEYDLPKIKKAFRNENGFYLTRTTEGMFLNWE